MHTTIAIDPDTRDRLMDLKRRHRLPNMDAVVRGLLDPPPLSARDLFERNRAAVLAVCRRNGITRLVAFGSRARGDAHPESDLDVMGRLPDGASLFDVARASDDLSQAFGIPVDWVSEGPHLGSLRDRIEREGVVLVG